MGNDDAGETGHEREPSAARNPPLFSIVSPKWCPVLAMFLGIIGISSCTDSKRANKTFNICFESAADAGDAVEMLQRASEQFGYRFREYGTNAKADLKVINADRSIIPEGRPVQAHIERKDGTVLLMASNFSSPNQALRVSFFYQRNEGEDSPFFRAVLSEITSLPNTRLQSSSSNGDGASVCTELR